MSNFVQIQSGNFRALVRPGNLAKVEDKLAKVKPPVHSIPKPSARDRARVFPVYKPGMSTAEYVRRYEIANAHINKATASDFVEISSDKKAKVVRSNFFIVLGFIMQI